MEVETSRISLVQVITNKNGIILRAHAKIKFERIWIANENIENIEVLKSIAKECGLDPIQFEKSLTSNRYSEQVDADYQLAVEQKIWTIPSYMGKNGEIQVNHCKYLILQDVDLSNIKYNYIYTM